MKYSAPISAAWALLNITASAAPGDVDPGFNPNASPAVDKGAHTLSLLPDGRVISGGTFNTIGGVAHDNLVRLNSDGTIDTQRLYLRVRVTAP